MYPTGIKHVGTLAATGGTDEVLQANDWAHHLFGFVATGGDWTVKAEWTPDGGTSWCDASPEVTVTDGVQGSGLRVPHIHPSLRIYGTRTSGGGTLEVYVHQSVTSIGYRG